MNFLANLFQQPELLAQILGQQSGSLGSGGAIPRPPQLPIQRPQLNQLPPFLPNTPGFNPAAGPGRTAPGNMPFIRNAAMDQVLGPLMQPNYGLPTISPFGQQQAPSIPGLGQPIPGLRIPGRVGIGPGIPRAFAQ